MAYDESRRTVRVEFASEDSKIHKNARPRLESIAYYLGFSSAGSIVLSIAISQILLGLAIVSLLIARKKIKFPPVRLPLGLFLLLTVIATLISPNPLGGWPQLKKFYVFAMLPVISTTFTSVRQIRLLVFAWSAAAFLSAIGGIVQFVHRYQLAIKQYAYDYGFFLDGRVKGFAGHWMTFGGEQMIVLLMLLSYLLFASRRWNWVGIGCLITIWTAVVLGLTRSVFLLGVPFGVMYLLWFWKRWAVCLVPALFLSELFLGPVQVRERVISAVSPHLILDSNTHRSITRRTGWRMVIKNPWFGLGPEQIGPQFLRYVPDDVVRPLPKGYYGHLHNVYLQYAAERGIPALLTLLWLIGKSLKDFFKGAIRYATNPEVQFVLHGSVAVIGALLLEGLFEYNLGDSEILTLFLTVISAGYLSLELGERNSEAMGVPSGNSQILNEYSSDFLSSPVRRPALTSHQ